MNTKPLVTALTAMLIAVNLPGQALCAERHALILCNQNYQSIGVLKTPLAEAKEAEKTLAALGFQGNITVVTDATTAKMTEAVDAFAAKLSKSDVALFFYGGHAVQAGGENYLLGIDSDPATTSQLAYKALPLGRVLTNLEGSGARLNLLILDCCRDNPLAATGRSIGSTRGLAPTSNAPKGTFIAYAADANQQAWDDCGTIGLYGSVLFEKMKTPGLRLEDIFIQTREEVAKIATEKYRHQQEPAEYSKIGGAFYFLPESHSPKLLTVPMVAATNLDDYTLFAGEIAGERKLVEIADGSKIPFRWCPPGEFNMGSTEVEQEKMTAISEGNWIYQDQAQHRVQVARGFWVAETEITQMQWAMVMETTLPHQANKVVAENKGTADKGVKGFFRKLFGRSENDSLEEAVCVESLEGPMSFVNYAETEEWCVRANSYVGRRGWEIALPSEVQWEYACRAGTEGMTYAGNFSILGANNAPGLDLIAWYGGNSSVGYTGSGSGTSAWLEKQYPGGNAGARRTGCKQANAWGVYDMIGNVREWCSDSYSNRWVGGIPNPVEPEDHSRHVVRGGSWRSFAINCRVATREPIDSTRRENHLGFRPVIVFTE